MTCHVCAKPNCVDDCASFPPPALKIGSAEHKLQELLKITDEFLENTYLVYSDYYHHWYCGFCHAVHEDTITHETDCPYSKLEQFKASLS